MFDQAEIYEYVCVDSTLAYRVFGSGPALLFIHGFPVHGYTWRKLLPELMENHTCYVVDLPGLGLSQWSDKTNFHFEAQAARLIDFMKSKNIERCSIIAHDTGATTARLIALSEELKVVNLVLFNTEIPGERPPWIELYQKASLLPLAHFFFKMAVTNKYFIRSAMGFKAFYADKSLLENSENISPYIDLMTSNNERTKGALSYLRGCDLNYMDTLQERHKLIQSNVLLIWGVQDVTFPAEHGKKMSKQFRDAKFFSIENASLMPHEEQPEEVLAIIKSNWAIKNL